MRFGLSLPPHQGGLRIALMHMQGDRSLIVEEFCINRPAPVTLPDARSEQRFASNLESFGQRAGLRRAHDALARGGLRYAYVDDDVIAYVRETREERLLCLASRAAHDPIRLPVRAEETLYGDDPEDDMFPADGPSFHVWRLTNG